MSVAAAVGLLANVANGAAFWGNASHVGPTYAVDPWDLVVIGGVKLPGLCDVKGIAQLEVDKKKAKGTNKLTLTVTGYQPGPFEVSCTIWTADQWAAFRKWSQDFWIAQRKARPPSTKANKKNPPVALTISHPALSAIGIYSCIVQGLSIPESASVEGAKVIKIKCLEHYPGDDATVTKTAKGSSGPIVHEDVRKTKTDVPAKPSTERADLGPKGPRSKPGGGSD